MKIVAPAAVREDAAPTGIAARDVSLVIYAPNVGFPLLSYARMHICHVANFDFCLNMIMEVYFYNPNV